MKLQNLIVIFIIIILPIILLETFYINNGLKTIKYQAIYDDGLITATNDAIYAFEQNTQNDEYSENPEIKREILKSSIKLFEQSLCNTCGISSYDTSEIEEYIPALVFGMYDGFYLYSSSQVSITGVTTNEHSLKNYVYYSEQLDDGTVIRYSLDNYVTVSGPELKELGTTTTAKQYRTYSGYLIIPGSYNESTHKYNGIQIDDTDADAIAYYEGANQFTNWFINNVTTKTNCPDALKISGTNDPEDENSEFVQHKRTIMRNKLEGVLNSTITAYSARTSDNIYKMPKLSEEEWEKIYTNISFISFFQGKSIGYTKYNGYCVLNSTNNTEYVNPNLMYFIHDGYYHNIKCTTLSSISTNIEGYKIGDYENKKERIPVYDTSGVYQGIEERYYFKYAECACYNCINGNGLVNSSTYDYVTASSTNATIKTSYWTSLARERNKQVHTTVSNDKFSLYLEYIIEKIDESGTVTTESPSATQEWSNYRIIAQVTANEELSSVTDDLGNPHDDAIDGNTWSYAFFTNGELNLTFKDNNTPTPHTEKLTITIDKIDTNPPKLEINGSENNIDSYVIGTALSIAAVDNHAWPESGIGKYVINGTYYDNLDDTTAANKIQELLDANNNVTVYVVDKAGNKSNVITITVAPTVPPDLPIPDASEVVIEFSTDGEITWNEISNHDWTNQNVTVRVRLNTTTVLGFIVVDGYEYDKDNAYYKKTYENYKEKEKISYRVYDGEGKNHKPYDKEIEIKIDKEKPEITKVEDYYEGGYVTGIKISVKDNGQSGINFATLMSEGSGFSNATLDTANSCIIIKLADLTKTNYKFTIQDNAGNVSPEFEYHKTGPIDESTPTYDITFDTKKISGTKQDGYIAFTYSFSIPEVDGAVKYTYALGTEDLAANTDVTKGRIYDNCKNTIDTYSPQQSLYVNDKADFDEAIQQTCYLILKAEDKYGNEVVMYRKVVLKINKLIPGVTELETTGLFIKKVASDKQFTVATGDLKTKLLEKLK